MTRDLFDFGRGSYLREDRVLRFILRLGLVLFVISLQGIVVVAVARLLWR